MSAQEAVLQALGHPLQQPLFQVLRNVYGNQIQESSFHHLQAFLSQIDELRPDVVEHKFRHISLHM